MTLFTLIYFFAGGVLLRLGLQLGNSLTKKSVASPESSAKLKKLEKDFNSFRAEMHENILLIEEKLRTHEYRLHEIDANDDDNDDDNGRWQKNGDEDTGGTNDDTTAESTISEDDLLDIVRQYDKDRTDRRPKD
jgi:hypothetical protein